MAKCTCANTYTTDHLESCPAFEGLRTVASSSLTWKPQVGKSLDDAMLDAINALPPEERAEMCERICDALTNAPKYRIVDGEAER